MGHRHHHDDHHAHEGCEHGHAHHHHAPANFDKAFFLGVLLNTGFILIEIIYGLKANSLALLADAGHNIGDVMGLCMLWGASVLARQKPSERFTYGMRSSSILASLASALVLLVVVGGIVWESVLRFFRPEQTVSMTMIVVAAIGVFINGATAYLFMSGRKDDLNIRSAYLHMAGDAGISLGVVVAGGVIYFTGWYFIDPLVSFLIGVLIILATWSLFKDALVLAFDGVPAGIDPAAVKDYLKNLPGVSEVHDLHIWAIGTRDTALTVHLVIPSGHPGDVFMKKTSQELETKFKIGHATIQVELEDGAGECKLAPAHVV